MSNDLYEIHISYYRGPVVALRSFEPYAQEAFEQIVNAFDAKMLRITVQLLSESRAAIMRMDDIAAVIVLPAFDERILAVTQEHQRKAQEAAENIPHRPPGSSLS